MWRNVWLRACLLHPALSVAPWVVLCEHLAARAGSDLNDIGWAFWVIPLSVAGGFVATAAMAARRPLSPAGRTVVVGLGVLASAGALFVGFVGWADAATAACHGRYECPF